MQQNTSHPKVTNIYNKNDVKLINLIQEWINENYFFWNLSNDTSEKI